MIRGQPDNVSKGLLPSKPNRDASFNVRKNNKISASPKSVKKHLHNPNRFDKIVESFDGENQLTFHKPEN